MQFKVWFKNIIDSFNFKTVLTWLMFSDEENVFKVWGSFKFFSYFKPSFIGFKST